MGEDASEYEGAAAQQLLFDSDDQSRRSLVRLRRQRTTFGSRRIGMFGDLADQLNSAIEPANSPRPFSAAK